LNLPTSDTPTRQPWWREPMLWLVLGGPALVVVASLVTAVIAWRGADPVVTDLAFSAGAERALQPALKARNHAASPR
jgi:hypothetical protein